MDEICVLQQTIYNCRKYDIFTQPAFMASDRTDGRALYGIIKLVLGTCSR